MSIGGKSGQATTYAAQVDLMVGMNPIVMPLQMWANKDEQYLLDFVTHTFSVASGSSSILSFTDTAFYCILGVTVTVAHNSTFNDYGGPGAMAFTDPTECPLWNYATGGPNPTKPSALRNWPFCFYWLPGDGPQITLPALELGILAAYVVNPSAITVKVYYTKLKNITAANSKSGTHTSKGSGQSAPVVHLNLTFEPQLGDSDAYDDYTSQQILYPPFAGVGTNNMDLGSSASLPNIRLELLGSFPFYSTGDCNFTDIIEDIIAGGLAQPYYGSILPIGALPRGLNCYEWPGAIQAYQQYSPVANAATNKPTFHRGA